MDINSIWKSAQNKPFLDVFCDIMTAVSSQICMCCHESCPLHTQRITQGRLQPANQQKSANQHTPAAPGQPPRDPGTHWSMFPVIHSQPQRSRQLSASVSSSHHQTAAPNQHQLPVSTTRQQHQTSYQHQTSFQFPPPGSSTKPALASSSHHQAAAPHEPASSKASSQSAVNSTTQIMAARSDVV